MKYNPGFTVVGVRSYCSLPASFFHSGLVIWNPHFCDNTKGYISYRANFINNTAPDFASYRDLTHLTGPEQVHTTQRDWMVKFLQSVLLWRPIKMYFVWRLRCQSLWWGGALEHGRSGVGDCQLFIQDAGVFKYRLHSHFSSFKRAFLIYFIFDPSVAFKGTHPYQEDHSYQS